MRKRARSSPTGPDRYKIIDLRPGTYTVSFTLTGFSTVKREGIEIAGSFAANVNADLTVGSLAETVTVSGESPIVDVQSTKRSNAIPSTVVDALPTSRSQYTLAVLVPGAVRAGGARGLQDVGGTRTMQITTFSIHGSRDRDQRLMVNGITSRNFLSSAWASNFVPDMGTAAETVIDYSSGTADSVGGGMGINVIPKEGGNNFVGSFFITGANSSFQGNNYTDELKAQGLTSPNELRRVYDINPSGGGPIFKDKLWFYGSVRWQESSVLPGRRLCQCEWRRFDKVDLRPRLFETGLEQFDHKTQRESAAHLPSHAAQQDPHFQQSRKTVIGSMG